MSFVQRLFLFLCTWGNYSLNGMQVSLFGLENLDNTKKAPILHLLGTCKKQYLACWHMDKNK